MDKFSTGSYNSLLNFNLTIFIEKERETIYY